MMRKLFYLSAFAFTCLLFACTNTTNSQKNSADSVKKQETTASKPDSADYAGTYKMASEEACDITITINKKADGYTYLVKSFGKEYAGNLSVDKQGTDTYLVFDGKIEDNKPKAVSGLFAPNTITIQNEGNSMNGYNLFKKCDLKYLEFKK